MLIEAALKVSGQFKKFTNADEAKQDAQDGLYTADTATFHCPCRACNAALSAVAIYPRSMPYKKAPHFREWEEHGANCTYPRTLNSQAAKIRTCTGLEEDECSIIPEVFVLATESVHGTPGLVPDETRGILSGLDNAQPDSGEEKKQRHSRRSTRSLRTIVNAMKRLKRLLCEIVQHEEMGNRGGTREGEPKPAMSHEMWKKVDNMLNKIPLEFDGQALNYVSAFRGMQYPINGSRIFWLTKMTAILADGQPRLSTSQNVHEKCYVEPWRGATISVILPGTGGEEHSEIGVYNRSLNAHSPLDVWIACRPIFDSQRNSIIFAPDEWSHVHLHEQRSKRFQ